MARLTHYPKGLALFIRSFAYGSLPHSQSKHASDVGASAVPKGE